MAVFTSFNIIANNIFPLKRALAFQLSMEPLLKNLILLLLLNLSFSIYASDKWEYIERIDPMTDKDTSIAFVVKSDCNHNCSSLVVRADGNIIFKFSQFMDNDP